MELIQSELSENCFVCNEVMSPIKIELCSTTSYSEKQIYQIIEAFIDSQLDQEVIYEMGICQNCLIKFNQYDELISKAESIQIELTKMIQEPKSIIYEENIDDDNVSTKLEDEECNAEDQILYEPIYFDGEMTENGEEQLEEGYQMEVVVDDTKENITGSSLSQMTSRRGLKAALNLSKAKAIKKEVDNFVIVKLENDQKMFQCDICEKTFKDRSKLKVHREIHTSERNIICQECGKGFKTMNCLRNHKRMHMPERTYFNCDQCEKKYTQKVQLKKHIEVVHMNRRDFQCPTCNSMFGTKSVLKMHMMSHSNVRSEECTVCGFRVHTKAKLRRHMKSHTGERDYQCGICNKKFLYSYNVIAHIRNVHEKTASKTQRNYKQNENDNIIESIEDDEIEYAYEEQEC